MYPLWWYYEQMDQSISIVSLGSYAHPKALRMGSPLETGTLLPQSTDNAGYTLQLWWRFLHTLKCLSPGNSFLMDKFLLLIRLLGIRGFWNHPLVFPACGYLLQPYLTPWKHNYNCNMWSIHIGIALLRHHSQKQQYLNLFLSTMTFFK